MHWWSKEELNYLREKYKLHTIAELLPMFNENFNVDVTYDQLKGALSRNKILSGRNGQFPKGHEPFNKGMKGINFGGKETQFKKGQTPINYRPVGSERLTKDGYVEIKVADPNKWRLKHRALWEQENGRIPKGYALIFGDGDKQNLELDNLILVSRKQLVRLNQNNLIQNDIGLTKAGILIADIYSKISERKKSK